MTINLFFLSISIAKQELSIEEVEQQQRTNMRIEQMKERQYLTYRSY